MSIRVLIAGFLLLSSVLTGACSAPAPPEMIPFKLGALTEAARGTDKGPSLHHYTEVYERFFFDLKALPIRIFEIGIEDGGSLKMWQEYFPKATIAAVDINPKKMFDNDRVRTFLGDQASREALKAVIDAAGKDFDILVDDGGHTMEQQQVSLGFLFPFVKTGGYYILEDIHTSIPELAKIYGVAPDRSNTTLTMLNNYMGSLKPHFSSGYMTAAEMAYLDEHVEYINLVHRPESDSIVAIIRKK